MFFLPLVPDEKPCYAGDKLVFKEVRKLPVTTLSLSLSLITPIHSFYPPPCFYPPPSFSRYYFPCIVRTFSNFSVLLKRGVALFILENDRIGHDFTPPPFMIFSTILPHLLLIDWWISIWNNFRGKFLFCMTFFFTLFSFFKRLFWSWEDKSWFYPPLHDFLNNFTTFVIGWLMNFHLKAI